MNCRVCEQELRRTQTVDAHHLEPSMEADKCLGCWTAGLELEKFLIRACGRTVMGDWPAGWLKQIIADPKRYLA